MSNTEMNRKIVQEGLDRKKTARRKRMTEAAHDAAERKLRVVINQLTQERRDETEEAQAKERREAEIQRQRSEFREARRAKEKEEMSMLIACVWRVYGSLIFASLVTLCFTHDAVIAKVAIPCVGLATIYCIATLIKYATWIWKRTKAEVSV